MTKVVKPVRPYTRTLTSEEFALLDDDDIDFSDNPELTEEEMARGVFVPAGKFEISRKFFGRRRELKNRQPCVGSDGIDYDYLKPDAEFWREATLDNINEAMDRLISRRRLEAKPDSVGSHKTRQPNKTSSQVSAS